MQGYFYLTQNWRYHPGDPAEAVGLWTSADFADSSWEITNSRLRLNRLPKSGWNGVGWFRLHLTVDSLLLNTPLAINLFHNGASEVYLDGTLLYQFGNVGASADGEKGFNATAEQPRFILFRKTKHLITVRYSSFLLLHDRPPTVTELGFRMAIGDLNRSNMERGRRTRFFTLLQALAIAVPLTLAILHLLLFLFYRRDRANFYFAVFTATLAMWGVLEHQPFFATDANVSLLLGRLGLPYFALMPLVGLRCLYTFFLSQTSSPVLDFCSRRNQRRGMDMVFFCPLGNGLLFVIPLLEMLRVVIVAIRRKAPGAWIIGAGFAAFSLSWLSSSASLRSFHSSCSMGWSTASEFGGFCFQCRFISPTVSPAPTEASKPR